MNTTATPAAPEATYLPHYPIDAIEPDPNQPRKRFNQEELDKLTASVKAKGVVQPILIRPRPLADGEVAGAYIVAGERRYRASIAAGLDTIPVLMRELSDTETLELQLVENNDREDVNALEEGIAYRRLIELKKKDKVKFAAEDIAAKLGRSRTYVFSRLKLTELCDEAQQALLDEKIDVSRAELIARIPVPKTQKAALAVAMERRGDDKDDYALNFRQLRERLLKDFSLSLSTAAFDIKVVDYTLKGKPIAGACEPCPKRSGNAPELFPDVKSADICTDIDCFHAKRTAHYARIEQDFAARNLQIITGNEAKQMFLHDWTTDAAGGYVSESQRVPGDKKERTYGEVIAEAIPPIMVRRPKDEQYVRIWPEDAVAEVLKAKKIAAPAAEREDDDEPAVPKVDVDFYVHGYLKLREAFAKGLPEPEFRLLAHEMVQAALDYDDFQLILLPAYAPDMDASEWDPDQLGQKLRQAIDNMPAVELPRLLMDIAMQAVIDQLRWQADERDKMDRLFKQHKITPGVVKKYLATKEAAAALAVEPTPPVTAGDVAVEAAPAKKSKSTKSK